MVQVAGELDMLTQPRLVGCVHDILRGRPRHLVLDLSRVCFMAASGLQALVCAKDACARRGSVLHLTGTRHRAVARPLQLAGLDQVFAPYPSATDALAAIETCTEISRTG